MSRGPATPEQDHPAAEAGTVALEATARGTVQGVGFRYRTRERAEELGLAGSAINLPDGSVRITGQGPAKAVAALIDWLRSPEAPGRVDRLDVRDIGVSADLEGFGIG